MLNNKANNYFLALFSILPVSIIAGSSVSLANILIIDISFLILIFLNKDYSFYKNKTIRYLFFLYLYLIFNTFISVDYEIGLSRNLGFIRIIILFIAFNYFFQDKIFLKKVLSIWILILLIVLLDIFIEVFTGQNILGYEDSLYGRRVVSFFKDEPIVGGYINGFYLIIIGYLFNQFKEDYKNIVLLLCIIFLIAIFLTGERSNSIRALVGFSIFYFAFKEYDLKKKLIYLVSTLSLLVILILNSEYLKMRYVDQIQSYLSKNQIYFKIYKSGFEVFKNNKLFGVGNKNYRVETCDTKKTDLLSKNEYFCTTHPHQIYFEMLSEHGIIGSIFIFYILYKLIFSKIKKILNGRNYIQIGCLIYLILTFLPLLPSGAFFNNYLLTLFTINLSILYASCKYLNIFKGR